MRVAPTCDIVYYSPRTCVLVDNNIARESMMTSLTLHHNSKKKCFRPKKIDLFKEDGAMLKTGKLSRPRYKTLNGQTYLMKV